jgi:hypothetical protein
MKYILFALVIISLSGCWITTNENNLYKTLIIVEKK